jgi:phenylacetate-CoA ligase
MVILGSEMVHDFQRRMVEEVLGARVFNHYTHWERAASILECEQGRLHAQLDYGEVEILDDEGQPVPPGVTGEIVATGFYNLAMPLLRYRTGDLARRSAEPCPCGRSFPVVDHIEGRVGDLLRCSDGSLTATSALSLRYARAPIAYHQCIQREPDAVEVRLVPGPGFDRRVHGQEVEAFVRRWLGEDMRVDLVLCGLEGLLRSPAGKIRSCVNLLPAEGGGGPATGGG